MAFFFSASWLYFANKRAKEKVGNFHFGLEILGFWKWDDQWVIFSRKLEKVREKDEAFSSEMKRENFETHIIKE